MDLRGADALVPPAVDTLPMSFAIVDSDGTIRYTNRAWREFGESNDGEGDEIGVDYLAVAEDAESQTAQTAASGVADVLAGERELFEHEYPCHSPEEERWFLMRAAPFTEDGERFAAIAHVDVTERHQYEREVEASNERLEQFADAASHDLKEPLRTVTSHLRLLERRYDDELEADGRELLEDAIDGAVRMNEMIQGLLEYSRVERRGGEFEPVDLDAVLEDVQRDLELRLREHGAEVSVDALPTVLGDANQLRQVFQNLLANAIDYSGDDHPRVRIWAEPADDRSDPSPDERSEQSTEEWAVSVRDHGVGIDPEDQDRIFEVFERLQTVQDQAGTGIGLTLCKRIVERHGGDVDVESEPGEGTTFRVRLPAAGTDHS